MLTARLLLTGRCGRASVYLLHSLPRQVGSTHFADEKPEAQGSSHWELGSGQASNAGLGAHWSLGPTAPGEAVMVVTEPPGARPVLSAHLPPG